MALIFPSYPAHPTAMALVFIFSIEVWQVDEVTAAADWWSVGALLYEIITGQV